MCIIKYSITFGQFPPSSADPELCCQVNLEKVQERWWEAVLVSEPTINVRNIDPSRPMSDLDDEAQAKIQEMMFNERQKQLGLPTSDDQVLVPLIFNHQEVPCRFLKQPFVLNLNFYAFSVNISPSKLYTSGKGKPFLILNSIYVIVW